MAKKTVLERVIDEMEALHTAARVKFHAEDLAMQAAIEALYKRQPKPRKAKSVGGAVAGNLDVRQTSLR